MGCWSAGWSRREEANVAQFSFDRMCFDDHHKMGIGNATGQVTMWMGRLCCTGREGSRDWPVINVDPREVQVLKVKNCIPFMEAPQQSARLSYSPRPKAPRCWWHEYIWLSTCPLFVTTFMTIPVTLHRDGHHGPSFVCMYYSNLFWLANTCQTTHTFQHSYNMCNGAPCDGFCVELLSVHGSIFEYLVKI